jgi:hypothetical protein
LLLYFGGVKSGTDHLTGPAAIAFVGIDSYGFYLFLLLLNRHGYTSLSFTGGVAVEGVSFASE